MLRRNSGLIVVVLLLLLLIILLFLLLLCSFSVGSWSPKRKSMSKRKSRKRSMSKSQIKSKTALWRPELPDTRRRRLRGAVLLEHGRHAAQRSQVHAFHRRGGHDHH